MTIPSQRVGQQLRQRADALHADNAKALLWRSSLYFVLSRISVQQLHQIQRVLDAAVLDPEIQTAANNEYAKSARQYGSLVVRDPAAVQRAYQIMRGYIPVAASDKRIRLDYTALLGVGALTPQTDNPDEADYLDSVKRSLELSGVWLRFEPTLTKDRTDPSRRFYDTTRFEAWLSLGPAGQTIQTMNGTLDRQALQNTNLFGARYYAMVDLGSMNAALDKYALHISNEIGHLLDEYFRIQAVRDSIYLPIAVTISDKIGGVEFPGTSIYQNPQVLLAKAKYLQIQGRVFGARVYLFAAAVSTKNAAITLVEYLEKSNEGASKAHTLLTIITALSAIVSFVGAARYIAATVAARSAQAAAGVAISSDGAFLTSYLARNAADDVRVVIQSGRARAGWDAFKYGAGAR